MTDADAGSRVGRARTPREAAIAARAPSGPFPPTEEMLDAPVPQDVQEAQKARLRAVWAQPPGWRYWSAVNNTEVGVWYVLTALAFMLCAGLLALAMRAQLAFPGIELIDADRYNQFFTMHGSAMMFLFAVPVFEAISILILPAFLGARDMPFPRLSAYGYWCFLIGGIFVLGSIPFDAGPKGGWFMYPPLSTRSEGVGADIWLLGLSFIEVASIAAAVELIVGTLKCRPPGMRVNLMPLYAWYVLVVGGMILFAFPPLIAGDFLFELQRSMDWPFFDPARGGDPLLWQHLFWIFGHPEVYIVFLPSIAIAAMVMPDGRAHAHRRLFLDRALGGRHGFPVVRALGPSHVRHRPSGDVARLLLGGERSGRDPHGDPGLRVPRHADGRPGTAQRADALACGRHRDLHHRRADRGDGGDGPVRLAGPRHLLHRRASALHALRRDDLPGDRGVYYFFPFFAKKMLSTGSAAGRSGSPSRA